jgi:hypothetical protein
MREDLQAIIERASRLSEDQALLLFWTLIREVHRQSELAREVKAEGRALRAATARNQFTRFDVLELFTNVRIVRPGNWNPRAVRREHEDSYREMTDRCAGQRWVQREVATDHCFACSTMPRALYLHHVIEVQHGGSNDRRNKVPLCYECHRRLHPWLLEQHEGFESSRTILPRLLQSLKRNLVKVVA